MTSLEQAVLSETSCRGQSACATAAAASQLRQVLGGSRGLPESSQLALFAVSNCNSLIHDRCLNKALCHKANAHAHPCRRAVTNRWLLVLAIQQVQKCPVLVPESFPIMLRTVNVRAYVTCRVRGGRGGGRERQNRFDAPEVAA